MSDPLAPMGLGEMAAQAGKVRPSGDVDDIDHLKTQCLAFINGEDKGVPSPALATAKTKLEEMTFWIRRHRERQQ